MRAVTTTLACLTVLGLSAASAYAVPMASGPKSSKSARPAADIVALPQGSEDASFGGDTDPGPGDEGPSNMKGGRCPDWGQACCQGCGPVGTSYCVDAPYPFGGPCALSQDHKSCTSIPCVDPPGSPPRFGPTIP